MCAYIKAATVQLVIIKCLVSLQRCMFTPMESTSQIQSVAPSRIKDSLCAVSHSVSLDETLSLDETIYVADKSRLLCTTSSLHIGHSFFYCSRTTKLIVCKL